MKYSIFYLIKGNAKKYQQKLVRIVGPKFKEKYVRDSKLPAHITLKAPFDTKNIKEVERIIRGFVKKQKPSKIKIIGFGHFRRFVAFLKFNFSKSALNTQKQLIKELDKIKNIRIHEHDKKWHPHATISYGNTKKSFNGIWNYLKGLNKPRFELMFDNITIMKRGRRYWKVYKGFKIK